MPRRPPCAVWPTGTAPRACIRECSDLMYVTAPDGVYAVVPETGELLWKYDASPAALRGLAYWHGAAGMHSRVFRSDVCDGSRRRLRRGAGNRRVALEIRCLAGRLARSGLLARRRGHAFASVPI